MPVQTLAEIRIWPISPEQIEATVADDLGGRRVNSKTPRQHSVGISRRGSVAFSRLRSATVNRDEQ